MKTLTMFIRRSFSVGGLIILLAAGLTSSRAQDTWTKKADFGGIGRSSATAFSIGDKGYLGTGTDPYVTILFKDFWEYDPAVDAWTQKADFGGGERAAAVGFSINGKGYIGTGFSGSFYGTYYNDFWEYDPITNIWTKKADFGGVPRSEAGGFSIGDKGYIGTGFTYTIGEYYSDFWEYDPATDQWTQKSDFGGGEWADPTAFSIGNKGYMGTGWKNGLSASFYEYDPAIDAWTQKANYGGGAIQYSVGFSIGNKGYIGTGVGSAVFYEYDPDLNKWTKKADYGGGGVNVAAGFSIGNKGYIGTGQTNVGLKSFWEYTPGTSTSCTFPSGLTTANITGTSAELNWDNVADALRYKVRYKEAGTSEWSKITDVKSNSKNISGLTPNTFYYWEVKSVCSANPIDASDWSAKQSFTTGAFKLGDEPIVSLELYPNPVSENFTLDLQLSTTIDQPVIIFLLNSLGQIIYTSHELSGNGELQKVITMPSTATTGWYVVRVMLDDQVMEKKLMYQK